MSDYDGTPLQALFPQDGFSTQVVENDQTHSNLPSPYSSDLSYATPHGHAGVPFVTVKADYTIARERQIYDKSYSPAWGDVNSCKPTFV